MVRPASKRRLASQKTLRVERLENRTVPTSTLYLDLGDNFPATGFELTDLQLRSDLAAGGLSGPNLSFSDATLYRFLPTSQRVTFDYNGSGAVNAQDWIDLRAAVFSLVQRYYEPFDVNVVLAPALNNTNSTTYYNGIRDALNAGPAVTGERDCWVFTNVITVAATGQLVSPGSLYGIASGRDIGGVNANDDSCVVFADAVLGAFGNASADNALAYTSAHEAAHNFTLAHTNNVALANSDVIVGSAGSINRTNYDFFTRYPLALSGGTVNNHDRYASTSVLGLRVGAPVLVTGTGEHDIITLTRTSATTATVTVQAFTNSTYTTPITVPGTASTTYSYTLTFNAKDGILIDGGFDNDRIVIDGTLGVPIRVRGMAGTDQLIVNGGGAATALYTPNATAPVGIDGALNYGGTLVVGSTTILLSEFETASTVEVNNVTTLTVRTPNAVDTVTVDTVTGGRFRATGTSGGVSIVPVLGDVTNLILDAATNDTAAGNDTITAILGGVVAAGRSVTIEAGQGNDSVNAQSLATNTVLVINAGEGIDTINIDSNGAAAGGTVDTILGPITVNGQGGTDTLNLEDSSDTTNDIVTANATTVGVPGDTFFGAGGGVTHTELESINLELTSSTTGDVAHVTPTGTVTFFVDGNSPVSAGLGDRLNLVLDGVTSPVHTPTSAINGGWTFANRQPVNYVSIEEQSVVATPEVIVGDGTAQRSRVTQLKVVFDHIIGYVGPPASAYLLEKIVGGIPTGLVGFLVNTVTVGDHSEATITFTSDTTSGSLNDGRYRLTVLANQVTVSGVPLATNTVTNFHRFFGDHNGDESVDISDFGQLSTTYGLNSGQAGFISAFDYNNDGVIDITDFGQLSIRIFTVLP
jgi:hypothetical protein